MRAHRLLYYKSLLLSGRHGGMSVWRASEIRDPHMASRRQADRQQSSCLDHSRRLVWSMPVSLSDASTHTQTHLFIFPVMYHKTKQHFLLFMYNHEY